MANFEQPLLQFLVSQDPSQMILIRLFDAWETFFIINVKNIVLGKLWYFCFKILWNRKFKRTVFIEIENFCNIINVFTAVRDQFISSLLNTSITFLKKKKKSLIDP